MSASDKVWIKPKTGVAKRERLEHPAAESLFKRLLRKIFPDQRTQERIPAPDLVAYLGRVRGSKPIDVGDVSLNGFRLATQERWFPGTEMPITLKRTNVAEDAEEDCFTVQATVVRWADEGVAFSILLSEEESIAVRSNPLHARWASRDEMQLFLNRVKSPDGTELAHGSDQETADRSASLSSAFNAQHPAMTHTGGD